MSQIPVQKRKSGFPWWVWLLVALAVLFLLALLMRSCSERPAVEPAKRSETTPLKKAEAVTSSTSSISVSGKGAATGTSVTDLNIFGNTADKLSLAGRAVELRRVSVARVLSDRVFTVSAGTTEMFAMLDNKLDGPGGREQSIRIKPGMSLDLNGAFRPVSSTEVKTEKKQGLDAAELAQLKDQRIYLHVNTVSQAR